ncbi:MAG: Ig-like domain-containing protein, partial [Planctomycetaceae bacterium]|nr:Ig-like domain-containing protein [Planctomycetaceae bacterium]
MRQTDEPRAPKGLVLAAAAAALATGAFTAAGCGGGGGDAPKDPENALLYVKSFNLPNYSGVFLDEDLVIQLSAPADEDTINPDSVQFRTGAAGGTAPYGVFVRGVFMVDPDTATRVVVDPDQISENGIFRAERGKVEVPDSIRIDLGNNEPRTSNGRRQPLFDRTKSSVITFVPEIPTRAALDDTGLAANSTYTVAVPGYPSTNTLENLNGQQLLSPNNRVFTSTFTTVFGTAPQLFLGSEAAGIPRVIHSSPFNGDTLVPVTSPIQISFSHPLDPRTVTPDKFTVEVVSMVPPYVVLPVSVFLAQQRLGQVAVTLTPINPMPADSTIRVTIDSGIEDLVGQAMVESVISFDTGIGGGGLVPPATEEFTATTDMDAALTTANWGNDRPYVGGVAGELTAAFAPYAGDGSDGAFTASVGLTTSLGTGASVQRVYNFTTFSIPIGAKVIAGGRFPLVIHCQGAVDISGELVLDGADGGNGFAGNDSNGLATGGLGGSGVAGGGS